MEMVKKYFAISLTFFGKFTGLQALVRASKRLSNWRDKLITKVGDKLKQQQ